MARLNVEDQFWIEITPLIAKLGNQDLAIGQVLRFWRVIQEKHKYGKFLSEDDFRSQQFSDHLFDFFAVKTSDGITANGADKQFGWLKSRISSGKSGGKQTQAKRSKLKQPEPSSSSSSSSSSSMLNTLSKNTNAHFEQCASEIYSLYPKKVGKKAGWVKLKTILKTKTPEDVKTAIASYKDKLVRDGTEAKYIKQFDTFLSTWEDWLDPLTGTGEDFKANGGMTKDDWEEVFGRKAPKL